MTDEMWAHLSVWPSSLPCWRVVLSDPPVEANHENDTLIVGRSALFAGEAGDADALTMLPDTFYWRELFDLDVDSLDALAVFAQTYGVPYVPRENFIYDLRVVEATSVATTSALPGEEVRDAVRLLRNIVRIWQLHMGALGTEEFRAAWEPCATRGASPVPRLDEPPPGPGFAALDHMTFIITYGIAEFSPYMRLHAREPVSSVFGATCAQLFNAVMERRIWHRCARCHRPFLRRWSTERVQYCGERCARAAASKAYRDRKRIKDRMAREREREFL